MDRVVGADTKDRIRTKDRVCNMDRADGANRVCNMDQVDDTHRIKIVRFW